MAFWPVSATFELAFILLWYALLKEGLLARLASIFFALDLMALIVVRQMAWVETAGVITYQTLLYPREITGGLAGAASLMIYLSIISVLELFDRDMFGRRVKPIGAIVSD